MKYIEFNYTNLKGKTSLKKVCVTGEEGDKTYGFEVMDLEPEQVVEFAIKYDIIFVGTESQDETVRQEALTELVAESDLKYCFRMYFTNKMQVLLTEEL